MSLLYPELLLLGLPLGWLLWRSAPQFSLRLVLRGIAALALLIALASPFGGGSIQGRDLILVIDRSRSMPADTTARASEIFQLAQAEMGNGDRMALVAFGSQAKIEQGPQADPVFEGFQLDVDADGSNLSAALDRALTLIPENRPGAILLYSDGEYQGEVPELVARRADQPARRTRRTARFAARDWGWRALPVPSLGARRIGYRGPVHVVPWRRSPGPRPSAVAPRPQPLALPRPWPSSRNGAISFTDRRRRRSCT